MIQKYNKTKEAQKNMQKFSFIGICAKNIPRRF